MSDPLVNDAAAHAIGERIAHEFMMTMRTTKGGARYRGRGGDKTCIGLARTVQRIIEEITHYERRVLALEAQGETRSDAQAVVEAEDLQ